MSTRSVEIESGTWRCTRPEPGLMSKQVHHKRSYDVYGDVAAAPRQGLSKTRARCCRRVRSARATSSFASDTTQCRDTRVRIRTANTRPRTLTERRTQIHEGRCAEGIKPPHQFSSSNVDVCCIPLHLPASPAACTDAATDRRVHLQGIRDCH